MNSLTEKEKKLSEIIKNLKKLHLGDNKQTPEIVKLHQQKNQLKIEYDELKANYDLLERENLKLKDQFNELKSKDNNERIREVKISQKIDELNQETDNLLDEIDKWQM